MGKEHASGADKSKMVEDGIAKLFDSLTPRQLETFRYISNGASYQEAGKKMGVSDKTVTAQMGKIAQKIIEAAGPDMENYLTARVVRYGVKSGKLPHDLPMGPFVPLNFQEYEICSLIYAGKTETQIASQLSVSLKSFERNTATIRGKLQVKPFNRHHFIARLEAMKNAGLLAKPQVANGRNPGNT